MEWHEKFHFPKRDFRIKRLGYPVLEAKNITLNNKISIFLRLPNKKQLFQTRTGVLLSFFADAAKKFVF